MHDFDGPTDPTTDIFILYKYCRVTGGPPALLIYQDRFYRQERGNPVGSCKGKEDGDLIPSSGIINLLIICNLNHVYPYS